MSNLSKEVQVLYVRNDPKVEESPLKAYEKLDCLQQEILQRNGKITEIDQQIYDLQRKLCAKTESCNVAFGQQEAI